MRKSLAITMFSLVALTTSLVQAENLFSSVSIGSAFGTKEDTTAKPRAAIPQRLAGPASLSEMLREAGLDPREIDTKIVAVKIEFSNSNLPVLISFTEDYSRLRMVMIVSTLPEGQSPSSDLLLGLMDANRENSDAFFAFDKGQRRTQLLRIVDNRSLTADRLKDELRGMVQIAEKSQSVWKTEAVVETAPVAEKPQVVAKPPAATAPKTSPLVGRWTSARSKTEAFALRIDAAGTFALVTVISGKTSQASGKFTLNGSTLTLTDDKGTKIAGSVTIDNDKQFKFLPTGSATTLTFKKA